MPQLTTESEPTAPAAQGLRMVERLVEKRRLSPRSSEVPVSVSSAHVALSVIDETERFSVHPIDIRRGLAGSTRGLLVVLIVIKVHRFRSFGDVGNESLFQGFFLDFPLEEPGVDDESTHINHPGQGIRFVLAAQ